MWKATINGERTFNGKKVKCAYVGEEGKYYDWQVMTEDNAIYCGNIKATSVIEAINDLGLKMGYVNN